MVDRVFNKYYDDLLRDKVPTFKLNNDTHLFWWRTLTHAKKQLDVDKRAGKASENRKWANYEFQGDDSQINAITRKLRAKEMQLISETPGIIPQFREWDDDLRWQDLLVSLAQREMRDSDVRTQIRRMIWDNFVGDISWGMVKFESQFSFPTVDVRTRKRQAIEDGNRIDEEHRGVLMGELLFVGEDDLHALHLERHEDLRDQIVEGVREGIVAPEILDALEMHLADHRAMMTPVDNERFMFERWPSYLVLYDPTATRWQDVDWYATEHVQRKKDLEAHPALKFVSKLDGGQQVTRDPYHKTRTLGDTSRRQMDEETVGRDMYVRFWVIHWLPDNQMIVVAEHEKPDQRPMAVETWPFPGQSIRPFVLNPVPDQIHGVSEAKRLEGAHKQLVQADNRIRRYMKDLPPMKVFVTKTAAADEKFWTELNDPSIKYVQVNADTMDAIKEIKIAPLPEELRNQSIHLEARLNEEAGTPEFAQAAITEETATATAARDRQFSALIEDGKWYISQMVDWMLTQMVAYWRENGTTEQLVQITGDRGRMWESITPADLPYGVSWQVDPDSLSPTARDLAKKQQLEFLQVIAPFLEPGPALKVRPVMEQFLRTFEHVEDPSDVFLLPAEKAEMLAIQQQLQGGANGQGGGNMNGGGMPGSVAGGNMTNPGNVAQSQGMAVAPPSAGPQALPGQFAAAPVQGAVNPQMTR